MLVFAGYKEKKKPEVDKEFVWRFQVRPPSWATPKRNYAVGADIKMQKRFMTRIRMFNVSSVSCRHHTRTYEVHLLYTPHRIDKSLIKRLNDIVGQGRAVQIFRIARWSKSGQSM